jgi:hypothetical protein
MGSRWLSGKVTRKEKINEIKRSRVCSPAARAIFKKVLERSQFAKIMIYLN